MCAAARARGFRCCSHERRDLAEAFVDAARGNLTTIVQVGHNSIREAQVLAEHAQSIGGRCYLRDNHPRISASVPRGYSLRACRRLPVQLLRRPSTTTTSPVSRAASLSIEEFLREAEESAPTLAGVKYTSPTIDEFQSCLHKFGDRFDLVWGLDERCC